MVTSARAPGFYARSKPRRAVMPSVRAPDLSSSSSASSDAEVDEEKVDDAFEKVQQSFFYMNIICTK
jgi:hypothetical protein